MIDCVMYILVKSEELRYERWAKKFGMPFAPLTDGRYRFGDYAFLGEGSVTWDDACQACMFPATPTAPGQHIPRAALEALGFVRLVNDDVVTAMRELVRR